jgi:hypothetical protein
MDPARVHAYHRAKVTTRRQAGAIGIDFNAGDIAVSHLDRSGNPLPALCESILLVLDGRRQISGARKSVWRQRRSPK